MNWISTKSSKPQKPLCRNYWRLANSGESLTCDGRTAANGLMVWASDCTFKDVLFRVDARLELPRGTLLGYEHKNAVKELTKALVVSFFPVRSPRHPGHSTARPNTKAQTLLPSPLAPSRQPRRSTTLSSPSEETIRAT